MNNLINIQAIVTLSISKLKFGGDFINEIETINPIEKGLYDALLNLKQHRRKLASLFIK